VQASRRGNEASFLGHGNEDGERIEPIHRFSTLCNRHSHLSIKPIRKSH
jgi:predicted glycosyltransferase involved in capsule biosynthesis